MDSTDQFDKSPLLDGGNSSQNTTEYTGDGSVCISGHPASRKHTGKWKASSLTLACSFYCYLAYSSIRKNLVSYLINHETNVAAARDVTTWKGTSYLTPLVGAFVADSYLGKYRTALISCTILIIGMMMLLLSTALPLISPGPHASHTTAQSSLGSAMLDQDSSIGTMYGELNKNAYLYNRAQVLLNPDCPQLMASCSHVLYQRAVSHLYWIRD